MIRELVKLANHLDNKGLEKEADYIDKIIKRSIDIIQYSPFPFDNNKGIDPRGSLKPGAMEGSQIPTDYNRRSGYRGTNNPVQNFSADMTKRINSSLFKIAKEKFDSEGMTPSRWVDVIARMFPEFKRYYEAQSSGEKFPTIDTLTDKFIELIKEEINNEELRIDFYGNLRTSSYAIISEQAAVNLSPPE